MLFSGIANITALSSFLFSDNMLILSFLGICVISLTMTVAHKLPKLPSILAVLFPVLSGIFGLYYLNSETNILLLLISSAVSQLLLKSNKLATLNALLILSFSATCVTSIVWIISFILTLLSSFLSIITLRRKIYIQIVTIFILTLAIFPWVLRGPNHRQELTFKTVQIRGFQDKVSLDSLKEPISDPTPLFRVKVTNSDGYPLKGPFHFRGIALDTFDGHNWTVTVTASTTLNVMEQLPPIVVQEYQLTTSPPEYAFVIPRMNQIKTDIAFFQGGNDTIRWRGTPPSTYKVISGPPHPVIQAADPPSQYTSLPVLNPNIILLAHEIMGEKNAQQDKVEACIEYLKNNYTYTNFAGQTGADPLNEFLIEKKKGHCTLFATALAILLRIEGIPTRLVNGLYGGEWNKIGGYWLLRQSDAHSWIEVNMGESGWVSFDPTPPLGNNTNHADALSMITGPESTISLKGLITQIEDSLNSTWEATLSFTQENQREKLKKFKLALQKEYAYHIIAVICLTSLLLSLKNWRRRKKLGKVGLLHEKAWKKVGKAGWQIPEQLPPLEAANWLLNRIGPRAEPLIDIVWLHYRVRYANRPDQITKEAKEAYKALDNLPPPGTRLRK